MWRRPKTGLYGYNDGRNGISEGDHRKAPRPRPVARAKPLARPRVPTVPRGTPEARPLPAAPRGAGAGVENFEVAEEVGGFSTKEVSVVLSAQLVSHTVHVSTHKQ